MSSFRITTPGVRTAVAAMFLCIATGAIRAQTRTINGLVLDADQNPLAGATVRAFSAVDSSALPHGAITDQAGTFSITLPFNTAVGIAVSHVGFEPQRTVVEPTSDYLLIELQEAAPTAPQVEVRAVRRTRSVEDACCRVESIRDEVQQHAPFAPTAADALARYSSCTAARVICAVDNAGFTRLRGLEPTYVSVTLDGAPLFSGLSTMYGLPMIPATALQTIRIVEGASSALHGNRAVSGVVNLETRPPTEIPEFGFSATMAGREPWAPDAADINASYTGVAGPAGIAAFGSYSDHSASDAPTSAGWRRFSGLLKANVLLDDVTELIATGLVGNDKRTGTHGEGTSGETYNERSDISRYDLLVSIGRTLDESSDIALRAAASLVGVTANYGSTLLDADQRTAHAELSYTTTFDAASFVAGIQAHHDQVTEHSALGIGYSNTLWAAYVQSELALGGPWSLLTALRADHHSSAGLLISPRAAIRFRPEGQFTMRLMAGQGFKAEALFDEDHRVLHGIYRWRSNPSFGYERAITLNADASYRFLIGDAGGADLNVNAYTTRIIGKAMPNPDSLAAGTLMYENNPLGTRLRGFEIQLRPTFGEHWSGSLACQVIDYATEQSGGDYQPVPLAPTVNVDATAMYANRAAGFTAETWASWVGSQTLRANPAAVTKSDPYLLVNFRAEQWLGIVALYAGATNLLDIRQSDTMPLAFQVAQGHVDGSQVWGPVEGREVFVGIRLRLGGEETE